MDPAYFTIAREEFPVLHQERVRYNEIDGQNIVFNGNYFIYGDIGVSEYFRLLGEGQPGPFFRRYGTDIYVVHAEIDYHEDARLDDLIVIAARVAHVDGARFTLHCAVFRDDERLTDILVTYEHVDLETREVTTLPAGFIADVRRAQKNPPTQG